MNRQIKPGTERTTPRPRGAAKVRRPRLEQVYARRRLLQTLDSAHKHHRIVWLVGPPGAGKTTLASSYVEARGLPCLWYQIDEGDNDVASFFHYLDGAAQAALPRQRKPLPRLTPEHLPTLGMFARQYFQALFARFRQPAVLVFDNYHTLPADSRLHEVMREGLAELPPTVSAVFVSRHEPPTALARLQIHNHITLVDAQALRLTPDETTGIARRLGGKQMHHDSIQRIHAQADGWAAGVVLMLGRGQPEPDAPEPAAPQALFDYFANEVFHRMDTDTRRILLESALLPTMTAAAVVQLTAESKSVSVLASLAQRNYFTSCSVGASAIYQYHALFRGFLLRELKLSCPAERLHGLRLRAASLLAEAGRIEDAVGILREAAAWSELARIIVTTAPSLAAQARLVTLDNWIQWLPPEVASNNAWLLYWRAQCRMMISPTEARKLSEQAFARFEESNDALGLYLSWSSVVSALTADWINFMELDRWLGIFDSLQQRHPQIPTAEAEARVTFSMMVILTNLPTSRPDLALWLGRATGLMRDLPDVNHRLLIGACLAIYYTWIGDMKALVRVMETLEPVHGSSNVAPMADIPWRFASALYYWILAGKPAKTLEIVVEALRLAETGGEAMYLLVLMQGIYGSLLNDDVRGASAYLARMHAMRQGSDPAFLTVYHHAASIIAIYENNLDKALGHEQQAVANVTITGGAFHAALTHMNLAWILYKLEKPVEASEHLDRTRAIGRTLKSRILEYSCVITEAVAALDRGQQDTALERLGVALALDKEMGGVIAPIRPPREWVRLYVLAIDHGIEVEHVRAVIRKRKLVPDSPPIEVEHWPWSYRLYTFARFSVVKDDKALLLSGKNRKKPLELLKTLISLGGREVSQQKLTETLWPDAEGDAAQHAFETALYRLRKLLGDEAPLLLKDGRLSLDARTCWVDCWAFERLLSKIEERLCAASIAELEPLTKKLFGLYRGHFLDGEVDVPPALSLRERLRSRFLRTLQQFGRRCETERAWEKAIDCYLQALEIEPLTEVCYQNLMIVYRSLGRRAEGLAVYKRCRNTLSTLLGVPPSPETEALRQSLETESPG